MTYHVVFNEIREEVFFMKISRLNQENQLCILSYIKYSTNRLFDNHPNGLKLVRPPLGAPNSLKP